MTTEGWEELESTNTAGKRKKSAKQAEPDTDQEQQLPDAETQPAEKQPEPMPRVITRICARAKSAAGSDHKPSGLEDTSTMKS